MKRILTGRDAYFLVVGNIIGIGIFTTPGYVANHIPVPGMLLMAWLLGGVIAFLGSVTYSELAAQFPRAGGDYHFLTHAFHPLYGFLFGWAAFLVTYTGSIATLSVGFAHYFMNIFHSSGKTISPALNVLGWELTPIKLVAIAVTGILTLVNARGLRIGARWQTGLTVLSLATLLGFIVLGGSSNQVQPKYLSPILPEHVSLELLTGFGVALMGIYFTYSGWTTIVYVAGEVREPGRIIPRAMIMGVVSVTVLYVLINGVYLLAVPISQMKNIVDVGYRALVVLRGERWSLFFSGMIMLAVLSTLNATILSGARIYYAMARDGLFFPGAGLLHPRRQVPVAALWYQFLWSMVLILSGTFNQLLTYTVFVMVGFAASSGIGLFILRHKRNGATDAYRAWGYPWSVLGYVGITVGIMVSVLLNHTWQAGWGVLGTLSGVPVYYLFRKYARK